MAINLSIMIAPNSYKKTLVKNYTIPIVIACLLFLLQGCTEEGTGPITGENNGPTEAAIANCAAQCGEVIDPVCGLDGEVYLSACVAECAGITIDNSADCQLCQFPIDEYRKRGLQKVRLLNEYISVIISKRNGRNSVDGFAEVDTAINDAVRLFVSENAQVEVVGSNSQFFAIRDYLNRIKNYSYGDVDIAWSDIGYVSDVKKGADGHYYWTVTVTQVFRGYKDKESKEPVYVDVTRKNIEVILKTYTISREGKIDLDCEVYLSDIGVKDVRSQGQG